MAVNQPQIQSQAPAADVAIALQAALAGHRTEIETLVAQQLAAHKQDILAAVASQAKQFKLTPQTQQIIAIASVAAILVGALGVLFAALAGNHLAQSWIAGVPIAVGGLVALMSRLGG